MKKSFGNPEEKKICCIILKKNIFSWKYQVYHSHSHGRFSWWSKKWGNKGIQFLFWVWPICWSNFSLTCLFVIFDLCLQISSLKNNISHVKWSDFRLRGVLARGQPCLTFRMGNQPSALQMVAPSIIMRPVTGSETWNMMTKNSRKDTRLEIAVKLVRRGQHRMLLQEHLRIYDVEGTLGATTPTVLHLLRPRVFNNSVWRRWWGCHRQ